MGRRHLGVRSLFLIDGPYVGVPEVCAVARSHASNVALRVPCVLDNPPAGVIIGATRARPRSVAYFGRALARLAPLDEFAGYDPSTQPISTTPIERLLVRNVCMVFDRYHEGTTNEARHSSTL